MTEVVLHTPTSTPRSADSRRQSLSEDGFYGGGGGGGVHASSPTSKMMMPNQRDEAARAGRPSSCNDDAERLADAIRDAMYLTPRPRLRGPGSASVSPGSASGGTSSCKTPGYAFGECDCAVCHSPLDRSRPEASDNPDKIELVTGLTCRHVFHKCCIVQCRTHNIQKCPTCQAPLPRGFTPESVREEREKHRIRDRIIARSRRATDAIRLARARAIVNGTASPGMSSMSDTSRTPGTPGMVSLSQDTGTDLYSAALPPLAPSTGRSSESRESMGSAGRYHPYSPISGRSPVSDEDGGDEFFLRATQ